MKILVYKIILEEFLENTLEIMLIEFILITRNTAIRVQCSKINNDFVCVFYQTFTEHVYD